MIGEIGILPLCEFMPLYVRIQPLCVYLYKYRLYVVREK